MAGLSAVIGVIAVRLNLVIPAYIIPVLKGLDTAYKDPRWTYHYFPSLGEWLTSIGTIAIVVLGFVAVWRIFPIFSQDDAFDGGHGSIGLVQQEETK